MDAGGEAETPSRDRRVAFALLACALAVLTIGQLGVHENEIAHDAAHYLELARSIDAGTGFSCRTRWALNLDRPGFPFADTYRAPLFPVLVAGASRVTGDLFIASKAVSVLTGAFIPPLTFLLARRRFGLSTTFASLAGAITVVHHHLVVSGTRGLTETPFTLAILATFYLATALRPAALLAGLAAGLAWLTRYQGTLVAVPVLLAFAWPRVSASRWLRRASAFAGAALLVTMPWLIRNQVVAGSPTYTDLKYHLLSDYHPSGSTFSYFHGLEAPPEPVAYIVAHPTETLRHFGRGLRRLASEAPRANFGNPLLAALAVLGLGSLWLGGGDRDGPFVRRNLLLLMIYGAVNVAVVAIGFAEARHLSSVEPFLAALSAAGVAAAWPDARTAGAAGPRRVVLVLLVALATTWEVTASYRSLFVDRPRDYDQVSATQQYLKANLEPGESVMAEKPYIFSYALDAPAVSLPWSSDEQFLELAQRYRVRFVCIGDFARSQPHPDSFLATGTPPPWLERVLTIDDPPLEVYEVRAPYRSMIGR